MSDEFLPITKVKTASLALSIKRHLEVQLKAQDGLFTDDLTVNMRYPAYRTMLPPELDYLAGFVAGLETGHFFDPILSRLQHHDGSSPDPFSKRWLLGIAAGLEFREENS